MKFGVLSLFFLTTTVSAHALTLGQAMQDAVNDNPRITRERARIEEAKQLYNQARAPFFPTADANASWNDSSRKFRGGYKSDTNPRVYEVAAEQVLFNGLATVYNTRAARSIIEASEAGYLDRAQTVLLDVVGRYTDSIRDRDILNFNEQNILLLQEQLDAANSRFNAGDISKTDVMQAQARRQTGLAELAKARRNYENSYASLRNLLGYEPSNLEWPHPLPLEVSLNNEAIADAMLNHPAVSESVARLSASKHDIKTSRGSFMPRLAARASYTKNDDTGFGFGTQSYDDTVFSLNLSVPLFRGGANVAGYKAAQERSEQADDVYEQTRREVREALETAVHNYEAAARSYEAFSTAFAAQEEAYVGVEKETLHGQRTTLDLLDAQKELLDARVGLANARRDLIVASYAVQAARGDLANIARAHDTQAYRTATVTTVPREDDALIPDPNFIEEDDDDIVVLQETIIGIDVTKDMHNADKATIQVDEAAHEAMPSLPVEAPDASNNALEEWQKVPLSMQEPLKEAAQQQTEALPAAPTRAELLRETNRQALEAMAYSVRAARD